jgi:hypothetical protein
VWFQFQCRCTDHSHFSAKLFRKQSPFHVWSPPFFCCRRKIVEVVVDNMRYFLVKNRTGWLCVIPLPVPLQQSFRFQCQTVQEKSTFHVRPLPLFYGRPKISEIVVDNMRIFHVKNSAGWLCVIPVPVALHRSLRFQCQTVQKKTHFNVWSLSIFHCSLKLVEIVVDKMRFFHVKIRVERLCVIPVPEPLHRSFRFSA